MRIAAISLGAALLLAPCLTMAADAPSPGQPDISGVFRLINDGKGVLTVEGQEPPLRPEAKALLDKRVASQDTLKPWANVSASCLPPGMPRAALSTAPPPFEILQTPGQVTIILEWMSAVRRVHLNRGHPDYIEPSWYGDEIGHWEGDTLVVDTIGLNAKSSIDKVGMPMSTAMHIIERIRRVAPNRVEDLMTIDDPKTFTKPWTTRIAYAQQPPGSEIMEYVCEDNHTVQDADGYIISFFSGR